MADPLVCKRPCFVIVTAGIPPYRFPRKQIYRSLEAAMAAFGRWYARVPSTAPLNAESLMRAHNLRINAYWTRQAARAAHVGDPLASVWQLRPKSEQERQENPHV